MAAKNILESVKTILEVGPDYTPFDGNLLLQINAVMLTLNQLGVGPAEGYEVDETSTWEDFVGDPDRKDLLVALPSYCAYKIKLMFDPPSTGYMLSAMIDRADELEQRLMVAVSTPAIEVKEVAIRARFRSSDKD